jgi:hypothetical protein
MPRNKNKKTKAPQRPEFAERERQKQSIAKSQKLQNDLFGPSMRFQPSLPPRNMEKSSGQLSKCALKYALAIADPFHPQARNACLPVFPSPNSQKVTGYCRFTVTTGTAGVGYVSLSPTLANNEAVAYYTTGTFTGSTTQALSANDTLQTGISTATMSNLPYSATQLTGGADKEAAVVIGRIVSCGLRITYTGTTSNESGTFYVYSDPLHENYTVVGSNAAGLGLLPDCEVCSITREPCELSVYPIDGNESSYANSWQTSSLTPLLYPYSMNTTSFGSGGFTRVTNIAGVNAGVPVAGIYFTGAQSGATYLVEIITHAEYVGAAPGSAVTPSDSDQRGFEIVTAAAQRVPQLKLTKPKGTPVISLMKDGLMEVFSALKPVAIEALKSGAMAMLM